MKPTASSFRRRQRAKTQRKEAAKPKYSLAGLLAQCDPDVLTLRTEEDRAWIGREFGSAEFDELERQAEAESSHTSALASVRQGLKESKQGKSVYRGSFAKHAKE
jgi:hypothetical protein